MLNTTPDYGSATIERTPSGPRVVQADDVIGISVELLNEALGTGLLVDEQGLLLLVGDPDYRYRPVCFGPAGVEGNRVLVCERVR